MTKIQHENVVKLFEVHETPQTLFLVMEILTGGELFDRIIAKGHYSEADARQGLMRAGVNTGLREVARLQAQLEI